MAILSHPEGKQHNESERKRTGTANSRANKIYRRTATAQIASYSWHAPKLVLVEMASMLNYIFRMVGGNRR
jgi:hypothetical protein